MKRAAAKDSTPEASLHPLDVVVVCEADVDVDVELFADILGVVDVELFADRLGVVDVEEAEDVREEGEPLVIVSDVVIGGVGVTLCPPVIVELVVELWVVVVEVDSPAEVLVEPTPCMVKVGDMFPESPSKATI